MRYDMLGIREFAEKVALTGGLKAGSGKMAYEKARKGVRLHKAVQKRLLEQHPDFVSEKQVIYTYEASPDEEGAGTFTLEGRTDGMYIDGDTLVITEIKSCDTHPSEAELPHYIQGAVYGFILSRGLDKDSNVRIDVIYGLYSDFNALKVFSYTHTAESLERLFLVYAGRYSAYVGYLNAHNEKLRSELADLSFIYDSFRLGQRTLAVNIYNALQDPSVPMLMCNAPTGIGKTSAALFAALKALSFTEGERSVIFYLTARNEGARPPEETLSLVCASAPELRFCSLEAKEKICIYDGDNNGSDGTKKKDGSRKCDPNNCPYAKHHFDNEPAAIKEAIGSERNFIDREFVRELSAKHMVCPFELMLDLTLFCDVVIGDYNYLFDPESYLKRWFSDESGRYYFLIDEAHQLPDRVRTMYSSSISSDALMRCTKGKKRQKIGKKLVKMAGLCSEFQIDEGSEKEFLKELDESADLALEYLEDHDDEKLLDLCFEMLHFKTVSAYIQSGGSILHHSDIDGGTVSVYCMDPSVIIREKCGQSDGAVLFSATLLPENYYKSELGGEDMPFVSVRSPFPEENMLALAGTFADTRYRAREASLPGIASFIENLSKSVKKGNYIVFFSSYAFMESVYSLLDKNFRTEAVFMQPRKSVQADRSAFVSGFTEGPEKLHIGFCVLGGSFSEGLDLPGDRLSGAVIVGTGLPQVGEYTELLRAYYDSNNRAGFESAYFYPGVNKVIQAAGRVIRSHEDRGFVLFLDSRYARRDHIDAISNCYRYTVCRDPEKVISMIVDFISEI